jgi:leucyl-tRNA synthetase
MKLYPEGVRKQFDYVIDWLNDWACTREFGLGTKLPWDETWIIESLSDSTIYMAYYTISKYLEHEKLIEPGKIDDDFFDYVFQGKGDSNSLSSKLGIEESKLDEMKKEFEYWYPFEVRISGKDLIQNHLTFCLFNHVALFPEKQWPTGFSVNGWVLVSGAKMSKSAGNFYPLREILDRFGADGTRLTLSYSGEGIDDPNFVMDIAKGANTRLEIWRDFAINNYNSGRDTRMNIDSWFESILARTVKEATEAMEEMNFRTTLKTGYFDLQRHFRWYIRRCLGESNKDILNEFIINQTKILTPITPHICEEIWEKLGFEGFITASEFPSFEESKINLNAEISEELLQKTMEDINEILKVTSITPKKIVLYTSPQWKNDMHSIAIEIRKEEELDVGKIMKKAMANENIKKHAKEAPKYAQTLAEELKNIGADMLQRLEKKIDEKGLLSEAIDFLKNEYKCDIEVYSSEDEGKYDPIGKSKAAVPGRPAIFVEA